MKLIKKEMIFENQHVPFDFCHASNICVLPNQDLLVAWFGGTKEGSDDTAIWVSRHTDGKWGGVENIVDGIQKPHWNPVLFHQDDGSLMLFYKVGKEIRTWSTLYCLSYDDGKTWSNPRELVEGNQGGRGPVRNKVIKLSDGTMIAGSSIEEGIWHSFADRSTDRGKTWQESEPIMVEGIEYHGEKTIDSSDIEVSEQSFYGRGVIQPTLWESEPGDVHMLLRSTEGLIYRADSTDYGQTWGKAYPTELPNNNSGIDVMKRQDGALVLCYNPIGENWGSRTPLVLSVSHDNGRTWEKAITLEESKGEFSYPCIIANGDNLYLSYTWNRKSIAVVHIK